MKNVTIPREWKHSVAQLQEWKYLFQCYLRYQIMNSLAKKNWYMFSSTSSCGDPADISWTSENICNRNQNINSSTNKVDLFFFFLQFVECDGMLSFLVEILLVSTFNMLVSKEIIILLMMRHRVKIKLPFLKVQSSSCRSLYVAT